MARELELNVRPIFSTPLLVFSIPEAERLHAWSSTTAKRPSPPITTAKSSAGPRLTTCP